MIILADKSHINSLLEIEYECFQNDCFKLSKDNFLYHIKKQNIFVFLCDNIVAGYILILRYKKSIRIYSIAVKNNYKNMGIGKKLCDYAIEYSKLNLKNKVYLEVRVSNFSAIKLYEKLGFKFYKKLQNYYCDEDGIKMFLNIF